MSATFTPSPEQRRKYADYDVVVKEAKTHTAHSTVQEGEVIRWNCEVHRYADVKTFVVFVYPGVTVAERALLERMARNLPRGGWAVHADLWFRRKHRTSGRIFFWQKQGDVAPDPLAQLELEMMIDATSEVSA